MNRSDIGPSVSVDFKAQLIADDVTQLFLSAALLFGLRCLSAAHRATATKPLRYFLALSFAIACSVLTKQLAVFSLPALGIMWLVCVSRLYRLITPAALSVTIVAVVGVFIVVDQLFPTPPGYYGSGLLYVFMRGSDHASTIQAMGTSLFALLPIPGHEPSTWAYPIFTLGGVTAKVIPLYFGQFAFFTAVFVMTFFGSLVVKRLHPLNPGEVLLMTLAVAAGTNLFMNTFLAGTHERYLYHYGFFVYLLLLSLLRTSSFPKALFALCLMHLSV